MYATEADEAKAIEEKRDKDMADGCAAIKEWEHTTGRKW